MTEARQNLLFRLGAAALALALALLLAADARTRRPSPDASPITEVRWPAMGTVARLELKSQHADLADLQARAQTTFARLERLLSAWDPHSELSRLAAAHCTNWVAAATPEVRPCYAAALRLADESLRAFNPNLGARLRALGMGRRGVYSDFDLGAIAKGFAVDVAAREIAAAGPPPNLLIDLGGNLRVLGSAPWRTGIRNPFHNPFHAKDPSAPPFCAVIALTNGESVATSGNYERFAFKDGKRVSHILDGRTGEPVAGLAGVTVLTPAAYGATLADGLSTTLFVLGIDAGTRFLETHYPLARALWIPDTPERPTLIVPHADLARRLTDTAFPVRPPAPAQP